MEDSDSKHNESINFGQNEETRLLKELQALMSCAVPSDLLMSLLQSQMLAHSNNENHESISHLLISYSGKRGKIGNITHLPLDIAQIIRYLPNSQTSLSRILKLVFYIFVLFCLFCLNIIDYCLHVY